MCRVIVNTIEKYCEEVIYKKLREMNLIKINKHSKVVLKPNWIKESHQNRPTEWDYVITHPTVISAVLRIVLEELAGTGKVIIADAPQTDASFTKIMKKMNCERWFNLSKQFGTPIEIIDLRDEEWKTKDGIVISRRKLKGDPCGSVEFNLYGDMSEFYGHKKSKKGYYGADYDTRETNRAHDGLNNLYRVSKSVMEADVFINLPKLKTHKKSGITCCLKNLVGINTYKNFLPHYNQGSPKEKGDQYPEFKTKNKVEEELLYLLKNYFIKNTNVAYLLKPFKKIFEICFGSTEKVVRSGNWYGNDTVWRMILDLNKILLYGNPDGTIKEDNFSYRRRYICIVDGILAGEGNGPLAPDRVNLGYIIAGTNPVAVDTVCAKIMGFDYQKIPSINNAYKIKKYKLVNFTPDEIKVVFEGQVFDFDRVPEKYIHRFKPHFGWEGFIEL